MDNIKIIEDLKKYFDEEIKKRDEEILGIKIAIADSFEDNSFEISEINRLKMFK